MSTPFAPDEVASAVAAVAALVEADGGGLVVESTDGSTVVLRLVLDDAECRECVMPRPFLEQVALDMMTPSLQGLRSVTVVDPREG